MPLAVPKVLEFDRVLSVVRQFAATPMGRALVDDLAPEVETARVSDALALTVECTRLLTDSPGLPLRAPEEFVSTLDALSVVGRPLEAVRLTALADFVDSADRSAQTIRRFMAAPLPRLVALANRIATFSTEIGRVRRAISPAGEVVDDASPALRSIRDRLRKQRARLRTTLESFLRGRDTSKYLQEQVVTDRNGRYVLVVRAEHRASIPGIVHGASTSGASVYLEPLSTVDVNNDIVALEEQEHEEVRRILLELTDQFRARTADLDRTVKASAELDAVQAKARFAQLVKGTAPTLVVDGRIELLAARHPLLIPGVTSRLADVDEDTMVRTEEPTPVEITIQPPTKVLVITGPNTGGKTVALKTTGLCAAMAQAGLLIPAAPGSKLPVLRSLFADIGDEQSIGASLSTFSSHISAIAAMDRHLALPALVLLDEAGTGTDPVEGGALATAIIDHFRRRGAILMATTHYDALKTYASTTEGVVGASFGFHPTTFAPTYQLRYGAPGTSLAFEIAARIGLSPTVIEHARRLRSERDVQLADQLSKMDREMAALDHERRLVARERSQVAQRDAQLQQRELAIRAREDTSKKKLEAELAARLREARREIDDTIEALKRRTTQLAEEAAKRAAKTTTPTPTLTTGDAGHLRGEARAAMDRLAEKYRPSASGAHEAESAQPADPRVVSGATPTVGARVVASPLGFEGTVLAIAGNQAEVDVNGKRMRIKLADLHVLKGGAAAPRVSVQLHTRDDIPSIADLNVVGRTVDDVVALTDKFLDDAVLIGRKTLRLIHGHGKGQLRKALAGYLQDHPMVERFGPAPSEQGGQGVTLVELKD